MNNDHQKLSELLTQKIGEKVTVFKLGEMGFPQLLQCKIEKVHFKDYAQYFNMLHIQYRQKGKRTSYVFRVYNHTNIMFYDGHVELQSEMFVETIPGQNGGLTMKISLTSFDKGYFKIAKASTTLKPFFEIIKD